MLLLFCSDVVSGAVFSSSSTCRMCRGLVFNVKKRFSDELKSLSGPEGLAGVLYPREMLISCTARTPGRFQSAASSSEWH